MQAETRPAIRDLVSVRSHPTVVRLEESLGAAWIRDAYYLTDEAKRHLDALRSALAGDAGIGAFLIGQYGAGKSHFLAYLTQELQAGTSFHRAPDVRALSMLNYPATARLEDAVARALDIELCDGDRRDGWTRCLARHPRGLLLVIDELSEFLRSKPDRRQFSEDIRFLQFLGELGQDRRLFVIAAVQEAIEQIGDFDRTDYRKIKDRFPLVLRLTGMHVRDLIAHAVLVKHRGYAEAVQEVARHVREALPGAPIDFGALCSIYPIHPATLELLEEVRDRFSQTRGVVDFVTGQLAGDPARHIAPFLDREWGSFVTPDAIVRHFEDVLAVQAEFSPLSRKLFPWYRAHLDELFETAAQRRIAEALLRLLVLVHLSPARAALTATEATYWLLVSVARVDPSRNRDIVERQLERLATRGRYVRAAEGRYWLDLDDDSTGRLDKRIAAELAELPSPETAFELLAEANLCAAAFDPFALPRDQWQARSVSWKHHPRPYTVYLGGGTPPARPGLALCVRLPWGEAGAAEGCCIVAPRRLELTPPLAELAAMVRLRQRPLGPEEASLLERRIAERGELFALQVQDAYAHASIVTPEGRAEPIPPLSATGAPDAADRLGAWLDACAVWMLRRRYGSFERVAPSHGPLPLEAHRALHRFAGQHDLGDLIADQWVMVIREGYLAPMGLIVRAKTGRGYEIPKNVDRNELVQMVLRVADHHPAPSVVYADLADSVYGLVPDQIHVLLAFLVLVGEIDVIKGKQSIRDGYETLPTADKYDRIIPGSGLGSPQLRQLDELCEALALHAPKSWTVTAQRNAVRRLRDALAERTRALPALARKLEGKGALAVRAGELLAWCAALDDDHTGDELRRFEQFLHHVGAPARLTARLQELAGVAERIDRQLGELRRLGHLLSQPALQAQAGSIGAPPELGDADAAEVDRWLSRARAAYDNHARSYRQAHDDYWRRMSAHPIWQWRPPDVARSRHTGLTEVVARYAAALAAAERARCARLANLDFQVACDCAFDGERAPIEDALADIAELGDHIERDLRAFFAQPQVRTRVRGWVDAALESPAGARPYLDGTADWPEVHNVAAFDEHLAGVDVIRRIAIADLVRELGGRTWEPAALVRAFEDVIRRFQATGIRIAEPVDEDPVPVVRWCVEHALRAGSPLPRGLVPDPGAAQAIEASWVSPAALGRLESLGLDERAVARVVTLIADRQVPVPAARSPLVEAISEVIAPGRPETGEALARVAELLYRHHAVLAPVLETRWLARLDALAATPLAAAPAPLTEVLERLRESTWLVIDALGLPLLAPVRADLEAALPAWKVVRTEFAEVSSRTTTDDFYRRMLDSALQHKFEKVNAIDELLHTRTLRFDELCALAIAELRIALGRVRDRLDPSRPLIVFADHGFRLDAEGRKWRHGGPSTLERVVPVMHLAPR
ncbi:MAG: hypothetical protein E6J91_35120 [Deltaproteobacteria bacterium]|nr:MAG: hypothetical protein E6J91_35120 [Deltaproteobacteria bacterium]